MKLYIVHKSYKSHFQKDTIDFFGESDDNIHVDVGNES